MKIKIGDYICNYYGYVSSKRDQTKDKNYIDRYQVIDIVSEPAEKKPTLLVKMASETEVDRSNKCWFSEIGQKYNIKVITE